jgi:hypothetical protein
VDGKNWIYLNDACGKQPVWLAGSSRATPKEPQECKKNKTVFIIENKNIQSQQHFTQLPQSSRKKDLDKSAGVILIFI